jgi:hypothetical protein
MSDCFIASLSSRISRAYLSFMVQQWVGGMRVIPWLSSSPLSAPGGLDRVSAASLVFPGVARQAVRV